MGKIYFQSWPYGSDTIVTGDCLSVIRPSPVQKLLAAFLLVQLVAVFLVKAENLYVNAAGAGLRNGSDWNNTFAGFGGVLWGSGAGQLGAGDTLWIAGGTYSVQLELKGSGAAGNVISIKRARATNAECATVAGWSAGYDAQVIINNNSGGIYINSSLQPPNGPGRFVTVDGQIADGIRCNFQNVSMARGISIDGWGSYNTLFRNIGVYGPSTNALAGYPWNYDCRCLYIGTYTGSDTAPYPSDLTFDRCTFAGGTAFAYYVHVAYVTLQYCNIHTIENTSGDQAVHQNLIYVFSSHDCTIRYNTIHDCEAATGIFFTDFGSSGTVSSNFWIYGNVFRDDYLSSERFINVRNTATGTGPLYIYNNTFVHGYGGILLEAPGNPRGITVIANNLFVDIAGFGAITYVSYTTTNSNLITSSYSQFANPGATNLLAAPYAWQWVRDLRLKAGSSPINAGANLGSPFNVDMDGNIRGTDGAWDIGAYEYVSGTNLPPADMTAPAVALTIPAAGAIVSNTITLTASASDNTGGSGIATVSFLVDGVAVGSVTNSPYTLAWNSGTVTNGSHTIVARGQDVAGNQASNSVNVSVQNIVADTTPPTVSLTVPAAGAIVSNTVILTASASDNAGGSGIATVSFLVDGVAVGSVTNSPYTLAWNSGTATNGSHTIQAVARDNVTNQTSSATVTVTVQNAAAKGEDLYVTAAGAGLRNGSDWNNAFAGFGGVSWGSGAGQLGAGDTLWIAGGTYSVQMELKGSGAAGNIISIKRARATNAECATVAGWSSGYDAQVIINDNSGGIYINSSLQAPNGPGRFVTIDGQITDGIRCNFQDVSRARGISIDGWGSYNTLFRNIGVYGPSTNAITGYPWRYDCRCLYIGTYTGSDTAPYPSDLTFDRCTFAGGTAFAFYVHVANVTVQYCNIHTIENTSGDQTIHQNLIYVMSSRDCTFRYNVVHDCEAVVGIFFTDYGSSGTVSSNFWIYGNVFRDDYLSWARFINVRNTATNTGPLYIYNNTFVHGFGGIMLDAPGNPRGVTVIANNLFVDIGAFGAISFVSYVTTNSNLITNSYAMFVDPGSANLGAAPYSADWVRDLRLKAGSSPINAGANLGSPFNVDMDGNIRGTDGAWDIGAYEYVSGTNLPPADTTAPAVALTIPAAGAIVSNTVSLTASASDNTGGSGIATVSFLVDGVAVGSVTNSPYTLAWNSGTVTNGSHTIVARVQDLAGNQASNSVNVSVQNKVADTTPPIVGLTVPATGAIVSNTVSLTASASDNAGGSGIATVSFLVDGVAVGSVTNSPYTLAWNSGTVTNGSHTIQAAARDNASNQTFSATVTVTVQNAPPIDPTNGLIGAWNFNNTIVANVPDSSGQGNDGTLVSPAICDQGQLVLNGTNGYMRVASSPALEQVTNAVTISAWVTLYSNTPMQTILRKVYSETTNLYPYSVYDLVILSQGSTFMPRIGVTRSDSTRGLAYGAAHPYGVLYHIAGTYDGTSLLIYVNGVLEGNTSFAGATLPSSQPLCIGRYGASDETVKGSLGQVRLYKRALSAAEIQILAMPRPAPPQGLKVIGSP